MADIDLDLPPGGLVAYSNLMSEDIWMEDGDAASITVEHDNAWTYAMHGNIELYIDVAPIVRLRTNNAWNVYLSFPKGGPVYTPTTERIYRRLPEVYRILDEQNEWNFKTFISVMGDQIADLDVLIARLMFVPPEEWQSYIESLTQYNTYERPSGITNPAIGETSDLLDGDTADAAWLPFIAQLLGAVSTGTTDEAELRDSIKNNFLGYAAGSTTAVMAAARSLLNGSKTVNVMPHNNGGSGTPLGPELMPDPVFDAGVGDWTSTGATLVVDTDNVIPGAVKALKLRRTTSVTADTMKATYTLSGLTSGKSYRFSAWVMTTDGSPNLPVMYLDVDGVAGSTHTVTTEDGWYRFDYDFVAAGTSAVLNVRESTDTAPRGFYFGRVSVRQYMTGDQGTMWDVTVLTMSEETPMSSEDFLAALNKKGVKPAGVVFYHAFIDVVSDGPLDKPVIAHTAYGQFTITNYNPSYTYVMSGGTRSGANIHISNPNGVITLYALDGPDASPSTYIERKAYQYDITGPVDSYEVPVGAGCPAGWNYENYGWTAYCRRYNSTKKATPAGYQDSHGEWWRVV